MLQFLQFSSRASGSCACFSNLFGPISSFEFFQIRFGLPEGRFELIVFECEQHLSGLDAVAFANQHFGNASAYL